MSAEIKVLTVDLGERSYPIYIGEGIVNDIAERFAERGIKTSSPLLLVTDSNVAKLHLPKVEALLSKAGYKVTTYVAEAGEQSKSLAVLEDIVTVALKAGLERNSVVVALGGGVVGDLAGFAAASYMRGIRFVQIPTTILAHDSSVGGKVAVNHKLAKNIIGAFHQPEMVLYDTSFLTTLSPRDVRSGLSEVAKHGLIWSEDFVRWCDEHAEDLLALDPDALQFALYEGCRVKSIVVSGDEKEHGLRAILNLGHTIGHALEAVAGYGELLHGEAIAIGMVGAAKLAQQLGYPADIYEETKRVLKRLELPVGLSKDVDTDAVMEAMMHDKKFTDGKMVFIIPVAVGKVEINKQVSADLVRKVVEELKGEE